MTVTARSNIAAGDDAGGWRTLRRGFELSPALGAGLGVTMLLAAVSTIGSSVIPVVIQRTLDNGLLTISAESHGKHEEKNGEGRYTRREFSYRSFSRSFTLPNTVEADRIDARYQDGILHLEIPKKEEAKRKGPRQIAIV